MDEDFLLHIYNSVIKIRKFNIDMIVHIQISDLPVVLIMAFIAISPCISRSQGHTVLSSCSFRQLSSKRVLRFFLTLIFGITQPSYTIECSSILVHLMYTYD